ncbi:MAG: macrolide ABC transporter ATP-binding protein [Candidatus Binatia bacterium]|nr:MAG: macrolide ABC transporter ATP-binding protein [Candidatus Binatia bacterium]
MSARTQHRRNGNGLAVRVEEVMKRYRAGRHVVYALYDLSLEVGVGEFLSIMGPSGCGKTTLLHLMGGLDTPDRGRVFLGGRDLATMTDDERSELRLRQIGFVFQSYNLVPSFTVEENVLLPLRFAGTKWSEARDRAHAMLWQVGISPDAYRRRPGELSGGEQQRVAIARALVTEPRLLLADEPTGNLDSRTGQTILELLRTLNAKRGVTVVMVTHNAYAATYGHRTIELKDGQIVHEAETPPQKDPPAAGES